MDRQEDFDAAVEHALWYIELAREQDGDWGNAGELSLVYYEALSAEEQREYVRNVNRRSGQQWAWDLLSKVAAKALRRDQTMPPELRRWAADNVDRTKKRPTKGRTRNRDRDLFVRHMVFTIAVYFDLPTTGNPVYDIASSCRAVAVAMHLQYKTVEQIWTKRPKGWQPPGCIDPGSFVLINSENL